MGNTAFCYRRKFQSNSEYENMVRNAGGFLSFFNVNNSLENVIEIKAFTTSLFMLHTLLN